MAQMKPNVVLLNDTSTRYHHGCTRVMCLLVAGLERHGLHVSHRIPARHDWANDPAAVAAIKAADLVVINGEGTLHHGKDAGLRLLEVATHPARTDVPVALVNAIYEHNPQAWNPLLAQLDFLSARDATSAQTLTQASGKPVGWLPDLSLTAPAPAKTDTLPRSGIIVGDSVKWEARRNLARIASDLEGAMFVPTKSLRQGIWRAPVLGGLAKSALYRVYNGFDGLRTPRFEMPLTEDGYLTLLAQAELHVTGRFHAVCLSMLTQTPFVALRSNASKIERLLRDAGLSAQRVIDPDLRPLDPARFAFSAEELSALRAFRSRAQTQAEEMFATLAALATQAAR